MIKAVIFDCFGVLTVDSWRAFCDILPPSVDIAAIHDLNHAFDAGFITHTEFFEGVEKLAGKRPPDINELNSLVGSKNLALLDYIHSLRPHYKTAILSNISDDWITRELLTKNEQQLFDAMVFSYEVKLIKPDPRVYELVCDQLEVQPAEAIMVDDVERNVAAARDMGMQGVVYADLRQCRRELDLLLNSNS